MPTDVAALLAAKRGQLLAELAVLTAPTDQSGIGFGKRVGEGTALAVERLSQVAAHERLRELLEAVERAEARLADGTWGRCEPCGDAIGPARLEAVPWATTCIACASAGSRR